MQLIDNLRNERSIAFAERLAARVEALMEIAREEYPQQAPMSAESLEDFLTFLVGCPGLAYPSVVLTSSGLLRAEWRRASNRHLALEFPGTGDARYVVFSADAAHPRKTNRATGVCTLASLFSILHPYGVSAWMIEAQQGR